MKDSHSDEMWFRLYTGEILQIPKKFGAEVGRGLDILEQAKKELREEKFRQAVEAEKLKLKRPWWKRVFPWKITIIIKRR